MTPAQRDDLEDLLKRIEEVIINETLPPGIAGDLLHKAHLERYERAQKRLRELDQAIEAKKTAASPPKL